MTRKATHVFIISTFVVLYLMVSIISTIHVIDFFLMSNPKWLAVSLAIAFEVGAAASLASIITLEKMNKAIVWSLFILLTLMQAMGNTYYTYIHLNNFQGWIELFGLVDEELIYQKRVLSVVSGAILPIVALGFIKALVDYIRPSDTEQPIAKIEEPTLDIEKETEEEESFIYDLDKPAQTKVEFAQPAEQVEVLAPTVETVDPVEVSIENQSIEPTVSEEITEDSKVDNIKPSGRSIDEAIARGGRGISFNDRNI